MPGREQAERLWSNIVDLGARRLIALGLVGLLVFLGVGIGAYYLSRPAQETLYTGLSREDVGRIGGVLKDNGIPFDVSADGSNVSWPSTRTVRRAASTFPSTVTATAPPGRRGITTSSPREGTCPRHQVFGSVQSPGATATASMSSQATRQHDISWCDSPSAWCDSPSSPQHVSTTT